MSLRVVHVNHLPCQDQLLIWIMIGSNEGIYCSRKRNCGLIEEGRLPRNRRMIWGSMATIRISKLFGGLDEEKPGKV